MFNNLKIFKNFRTGIEKFEIIFLKHYFRRFKF